MAEISRIPIIKLHQSLIVSIQTSLSDRLVSMLKDDITARITETNCIGLIIDLSGIDLMDSYISRTIRDIGLIAQLMGVETIISGMHPMIAMTLIEMDMDLRGVRSALSLEHALEMLPSETQNEDGEDKTAVWD